MRITLAHLRREVWRILTKELDVIYVTTTAHDCSAHSEYDEKSITIWADHMETRLDHAVVHEILHKILDEHFQKFATYHLYECWIESLEKKFFKPISRKDIANKWHKVMRAKLVIQRR